MKDNFKLSDKELMITRNTIFKNYGIAELEKNGYVKSPFKTSWFDSTILIFADTPMNYAS